MNGWPYDPQGSHAHVPGGEPGTRMANLMVPIVLPQRKIAIHMIMPEADARAIVNTADDLAREMGPLFEVIKNSLTEFMAQEG